MVFTLESLIRRLFVVKGTEEELIGVYTYLHPLSPLSYTQFGRISVTRKLLLRLMAQRWVQDESRVFDKRAAWLDFQTESQP